VCVALFLLNRYWGIVTVPGSFLESRDLGYCRLRRLGRSKVRSASLVRVLSDGKISRARGPKICVILHRPQLKQSNACSFEKKKEEKRQPEGETPALVALESY